MLNTIRLTLLAAFFQLVIISSPVQATSRIEKLKDDIIDIENKPLIEKGESIVKAIDDVEEGLSDVSSTLAASGSVQTILNNTSFGQSLRQRIANYRDIRSTILEYAPVPLNTIASVCGAVSTILLMRLPYMDPESEEYKITTKALQGITVTTTALSMIVHWVTREHNKDLLRVQAEAEEHKKTIKNLEAQMAQNS